MNFRLFSDNILEVSSRSSAETERLGFLFGRRAYPGLALLLHGGLGMGKTVLAKGIGAALGIKRIKSPSFIIVSEHKDGNLPLAHADLYRLEDCAQAEELDLESCLEDGFLLVVEWAERWRAQPETDKLEFFFEQTSEDAQVRTIRIRAYGARARALLLGISTDLRRQDG